MRAGALRHKVTLKSPSGSQDAYGETSLSFSDVADVRASISPLSGRELMNAQQVNSDVTHRVTIRFYSGVQPSWRVVFGTRTFEVQSVRNLDERDRTMELMCVERTD